MNEKIIQVFYDALGFPFKDKERTVRFPIVGQAFLGASNTTEIRFYYDLLGDNSDSATYVASAKLPNGKLGYKLLTTDFDEDGHYAKLQLSTFYTQVKGDLYISLRSYRGGAEIIYDDVHDIYKVEGDPIIQGTGSIKLTITYAVQGQDGNVEDEVTFEAIFAAIGEKLSTLALDYIKVFQEDNPISTSNVLDYDVGMIFFDKASNKFYVRTGSSPYYALYPFSNFYYEADNTTTFKEIATLGHFVVVNYNDKEYLVFANVPASGYYVFTIFDLLTAGKLFTSRNESVAITDNVLFSTIVSNNSNPYAYTLLEQKSTNNTIYGINGSGQQVQLSYSDSVLSNAIVKRTAQGQVRVPTPPADNNDATSKRYVDAADTTLQNNIDAIITISSPSGTITGSDATKLNNPNIRIYNSQKDVYYERAFIQSGYIYFVSSKLAKGTTSDYSYFEKEIVMVNPSASPITFNVGTMQYNFYDKSQTDTKFATINYANSFGYTLDLSVDSSTYVVTAILKDRNNNVLSTQTIDLPLESVVVSASYDNATQSIIITLQNGTTTSVPIGALVSGLVATSDITINGGYVSTIKINNVNYPVAQNVTLYTTPKVVATTSDLPVENDGYLYLVLADGYLYYWSANDEDWVQGSQYAANLLNYLEAKNAILYSQHVDLNSIMENCTYILQAVSSNITNLPSDYALDGRVSLFITQYGKPTSAIRQYTQIIFDFTNSTYYVRAAQSVNNGAYVWSTWKKYFIDFSSMLANYLKSDDTILLNQSFDLNSIKDNSTHRIQAASSNIQNLPTGYVLDGRVSYLISQKVIYQGQAQVFQMLFDISNNTWYYRNYTASTNTWDAWLKSAPKNIYSIGVNPTISNLDDLPNGIIGFVSASTPTGLPTDLHYGGNSLIITTRVDETSHTNFDSQMILTGIGEFAYRVWYNGAWQSWNSLPKTDALIEIGAGKTYTTLKAGFAAAHNINNAKVIVYPGTYDLATEFATEIANHSGSGILIGKGMDITFLAGTYVTCLLDGTNSWAYTNFEPFRINPSEDSTFTLRGLNIKCSNTRYCVHDEASSGSIPYYHRYIECHMEQINNVTPAYYVQCIGGGMGRKGYISIEGGWYKSYTDYAVVPDRFPDMTKDDWQEPISFHNGANANCDGKIYIRDVYFADKGYPRFGYYGASTTVTQIEITNCSMDREPWLMAETVDSINVNFAIVKWNNEIRGS